MIKKNALIEVNNVLACVISSSIYNKSTEMVIALPIIKLDDETYKNLDDSYGFLVKDKVTGFNTVIRCDLPNSFEISECKLINTIPEKTVDEAILRFKTIIEE